MPTTFATLEEARQAYPGAQFFAPLNGDRSKWVACHNYATARTILTGA